MSEENNQEAEVTNDAPVQAEASAEDLQNLVSVFDDDEGTQEYKSTGSNPESDDDWGDDLNGIQEKITSEQTNEDDTTEEAPEADNKQQASTEEEGETEADVEASGAEDDEKSEPTDKPGTIEVKTQDGILELTLEQIRDEHPEILQRLKNEVSGEKEIARRFSEFDKEKTSFLAEKEEIEGYIGHFAEATKDGNVLGGLTYFAEFANIPPYLLKEQLIAALRPELDKRSMMSQDEINNSRLKEENEYLIQKNESDTQKWQQEQARAAEEQAAQNFRNQVNSIRETHKVTDEEWETARDQLDEELPSDVATIPLSAMQDRILELREQAATETLVNSLVEPVRDQVNDAFVDKLKTMVKNNPDLTKEDLQIVVKDSLKIRADKELKQNLEKKSLEKPKKVIPQDSDRSFESLSDLVEWD